MYRKKAFVALTMAVFLLLSAGFAACAATNKTHINLTIPSEMTSLDPYYTTAIADLQLLAQMYESMFFMEDDTSLSPRLAESYTLADDGMTYTFKLRDAKFHNGEKLTADDVVFSFERAKKAPAMANRMMPVDTVRAIDDKTVEIKTKEIMTAALNYIVGIDILNRKAVEAAGDKFGTTPVDCGTGPYKVVKYDPSSRVEFVAFDDYYRGAPSIKTITYRIMTDTSSALIAFESGELDMVQIPLSNWGGIVDSKKYTTKLGKENHISYMAINIDRKPFDNKKLRQALAYAMDKEAVVIASYEGLAEIADFMMNPEYLVDAPNDGIKYTYDPEKAKALLAEAGYPDGVDLGEMLIIGSSYWPKIAQVLQQNYADIGVTCTIQPMDTSAVIQNMRKGTYGFGLMGLTCDRDYSFFARSAHSRSVEIAAVKYRDKKIDELFDRGAVELDHTKRQAIYRELNDYLSDICGMIPILFRTKPFAWSKDLNADMGLGFYYVFDFNWK
ncbi:ABC transporter substrate-binding protein [Synergistaceae bacterium OttesenSCG-928-I11]|nr:ABC transporter substrate-binding protein [Synergistaceae bacterium OttesenSCG-928-I11]